MAMKKKAQVESGYVIGLLLVLLVVVMVVIFLFNSNINRYFNFLPSFKVANQKEPVVVSEINVPQEVNDKIETQSCILSAEVKDDKYIYLDFVKDQEKTNFYLENDKIYNDGPLFFNSEIGKVENEKVTITKDSYKTDESAKKIDNNELVRSAYFCEQVTKGKSSVIKKDSGECPINICKQNGAGANCLIRGDNKGLCTLTPTVVEVLNDERIQSFICGLGCGVSSVCDGGHEEDSWHYYGEAFDVGCSKDVEKLKKIRDEINRLYPNIKINKNENTEGKLDVCKNDGTDGNCCEIHSPTHLHCQFPILDKEISDSMKKIKDEKGIYDGFSQASQSCKYSGTNNEKYSKIISKYSGVSGIDPMLILALIIKESGCRQNIDSKSGSTGLMQISQGTFDDICKDKDVYGRKMTSFDDVKGENNAENNIACGIKILEYKYKTFGVPENKDVYSELVSDNCADENYKSKYLGYSGWDAALRAYNGLGCNPSSADINYVDKINNLLNGINSGN